MTITPEIIAMSIFLIFCRIGGCITILPGFSTSYVPIRIRLWIAISFSIVLFPFLWDMIYPKVFAEKSDYLKLIMMESLLGFLYGFIVHMYTLGLQFLGNTISTAIGLNLQMSMGISETTPETSFGSFIGVMGLLVLWVTDFHHHIFYEMVKSYEITPIGNYQYIRFDNILFYITNLLQKIFIIMTRLSGPFLFFCVVFNFSIGLLNKLVPQIPVYFVSAPYMIGLGCLIFYSLVEMIIYQISHSFKLVF
ncbi:flagellar biosynthetic protein FliR [Candidatus Liberibacter americanus]|uniref:Flagellar biosynthesis protein FliR n=1 Tax=Candidatus Liberibacter americanus str. Sao Paulo TaxID=1261131 RepID=U6B3Y3_9HYPH|nr:flagellar biosynthetic protein FliR [Candidatus Liberibacter americanus]AHA27764.1 Flagellar biosynthesis protein FliR [Candidatus Liberibacter americanus str. Sao Paulo]EMS36149.1 flagellar biosynthesis protein FliR [Candidatus Liberibacter americanus PW_SP]